MTKVERVSWEPCLSRCVSLHPLTCTQSKRNQQNTKLNNLDKLDNNSLAISEIDIVGGGEGSGWWKNVILPDFCAISACRLFFFRLVRPCNTFGVFFTNPPPLPPHLESKGWPLNVYKAGSFTIFCKSAKYSAVYSRLLYLAHTCIIWNAPPRDNLGRGVCILKGDWIIVDFNPFNRFKFMSYRDVDIDVLKCCPKLTLSGKTTGQSFTWISLHILTHQRLRCYCWKRVCKNVYCN